MENGRELKTMLKEILAELIIEKGTRRETEIGTNFFILRRKKMRMQMKMKAAMFS